MRIKELNYNEFKNKKYSIEITSNKYLDIKRTDDGFDLKWISCDEFKNVLEDEMLSEWLETPKAYGAYINDELVGVIEGSFESWNNRYRISNIVIFDSSNQHKGIGKLLLDKIIEEAKKYNSRMIVLETQSYNYKAISFYKKNGFEIIGFDLYAYSNKDSLNHNIRIEKGKILK